MKEFDELVQFCRKSAMHDPWVKKRGAARFCDGIMEEAAEAKEAMEKNDTRHLQEELGDVMYDWLHTVILSDIDIAQTLACARRKFSARKPFIDENRMVDIDEAKRLWRKAKYG